MSCFSMSVRTQDALNEGVSKELLEPECSNPRCLTTYLVLTSLILTETSKGGNAANGHVVLKEF